MGFYLDTTMRHGSLFSGIGGFDLAAEWMGWENVFHCEWNELGKKTLKYYWPKAESFNDITKTDFTKYANKIDILTGGFPCQPYSHAGKRLGKEDERHLWPEMLRAIREIQPRFIVGENVLGIVSWNGGMVFEEVQTDLENEGYEVQTVILPACAVGASHRRERVWFIAYSSSERRDNRGNNRKERHLQDDINRNAEKDQPEGNKRKRGISEIGEIRNDTNTNSSRQQRQRGTKRQINTKEERDWKKYRVVDDGGRNTQSPICVGNNGVSSELDGITLFDWRKESTQGAGNAIVPQVAFEIFKVIGKLNYP